MECFIRGFVWVKGCLIKSYLYLVLIDVRFKKNSEFMFWFLSLLFDIECNGEGVLFLVGLVGENIDMVLMIG